MAFHPELPSKVPARSTAACAILVLTSCVTATTIGYDGSMMNALNILPSYTDYFSLTTTTLALNSAAIWMGAAIAGLLFGKVPDIVGRKWSLLYGAIFTLIGVILQAAAQNIGMFVTARIIIGVGTGCSSIAAPILLAETLPLEYRAWGLALMYDFYYVGGLISAGVTYGTGQVESTWAWRGPSALQGLFSLICIVLVAFVPESPRWLQDQGRSAEALLAVAQTHSDGDVSDPITVLQYREIIDVLALEETLESKVSLLQTVRNPGGRKRMLLLVSLAIFSMLSGNNIISYYLGTMLTQAGITSSKTQLEINVILNAFCLVCAIAGTASADSLGRKSLAVISTAGLTLFVFLVGALTKIYGDSTNTSGIYGTVAAIFLFQGSYSFGYTPLTVLYPPEVLNYSIRGSGMGVYTFVSNGIGLMVTFAFPFALEAIGWKTYMINGTWDIFELAFVMLYWVETKGRTLEEIDEIFDGELHSDVPMMKTILGVDPAERENIVKSVVLTKADDFGRVARHEDA